MKKSTVVLATAITALIFWITLSWVDVFCHSLSVNHDYSDLNFFVLLCEWGEEIHGEALYE